MAGKSKVPNKDVLETLLRLTQLPTERVKRELNEVLDDRRTVHKVFLCAEPVAAGTLNAVAEYFSRRLAPLITLQAEELCAPSPALQMIVDRFRAPAPCPARCAVLPSQYTALDALKAHIEAERIRLDETPVAIASFTFHTLLHPYLDHFVNGIWRAREVTLYAGTADTASRLGSDRQRELIHKQQDALETDFARALKSGRLKIVRHTAPPTFQGYLIPNVAVCVGLFAWFPTFFDAAFRAQLGNLIARMEAASVSRPEGKRDTLTLNGHYMPHFQVFWNPKGDNSEFTVLQRAFELYLDTHRTHQGLGADGNAPDAAAG